MKVATALQYTVLMQIVRLVVGLLRAKLIALHLGPAGVGIIGQAQNLQMLALSFASLSLATGYISRTRTLNPSYSESYRGAIHGTILLTVLAAAIGTLLVGGIFWNQIEALTFSQTVPPGLGLLLLVSIPFLAFAQSFFEPKLLSDERYPAYVGASIAASIGSLILLYFLLASENTQAIGFYLLGTAVIGFFSFLLFASVHKEFWGKIHWKWKWSHLRPVLKVAVAIVITSLAYYGTAVYLRSLIIDRYGAEYAGYIQVPIVIFGYYTPFLTHVLWNYFFPRLTTTDPAKKQSVVNTAFQFTSALQVVAALWIMVIPGILIRAIYSPEFGHSIKILPIQLLGDHFYLLLTCFSLVLLSENRVKTYGALWLAFSFIEVLSGHLLIEDFRLALRSMALAHLVASAITLFVFYGLWKGRQLLHWSLIVGAVAIGTQSVLLYTGQHFVFRFSIAMAFTFIALTKGWIPDPRDLIPSFKRSNV
jgi:O-antigen/teichoic acid export membrane protein